MTRARMSPRCEAHRKDGQRCRAPAIPGGWVCLRHGGSAPQVRLRAGRVVRQERVYAAWQEVEERERGTERWYQAWDRFTAAEADLRQYEDDLDLVALLRMEARDPSGPAARAALLEAARARLDGRPWTSPVRRLAMDVADPMRHAPEG